MRLNSAAVVGAIAVTFCGMEAANAAIIGVGDEGRWGAGGSNTISNLGLNMTSVPNDPSILGGYTPISQISAPSNTLSFGNIVYKAFVGSDWAKLAESRFTNGAPIYFNGGANTLTITLAQAVAAFDLIIESNSLAPLVFNIQSTAFGNNIDQTLTQAVTGSVGGKYFGFYGTDGDLISSITITAPTEASGFAVGEFRLGSSPVQPIPTPALLPGLIGIGVAALRKRKAEQKESVEV